MSEQTAEETAETAPTESETPSPEQLPTDHPLVKTLAEQKKAIKDLKAKASRLDAIEEAQKSEAEKAADRIAKAEAEVASVPAKVSDALKSHLVDLHKIDKEDAELFLTASEPDLLLKQIARLLARSDEQTAASKRNGNHVPREGANPATTSDDARFAHNLFAAGN
jgi:phage-related tail protein